MTIITSGLLLLDSALQPANGRIAGEVTARLTTTTGIVTKTPFLGVIKDGEIFGPDGVSPLTLPATTEGEAVRIWEIISGKNRDGNESASTLARVVTIPDVATVAYSDLLDVELPPASGIWVIPPYIQTLIDQVTADAEQVALDRVAVAADRVAVEAVPTTSDALMAGALGTGGEFDTALDATIATIYKPEKYGAVGDGVTNDTAAVQAALQAAYNAGGGTVYLSTKVYRCDGQLYTPNDGLAFPSGRAIRITGTASDGALYPTNKGAVLDLRYSGAGAKILALGRGILELDHFVLTDKGASSTPFLLTTNTILNAHDMTVIGNPSKSTTTCDQDVFILGGTVAISGGLQTSGFQGYGSTISKVQFARIRRAVYGRVWVNSVVIRDNIITSSCGASGAQGAIELDSSADAAGFAWGNVVTGNLIQMNGYKNGIRLINASRNFLSENSFWDQNLNAWIGDYNLVNSNSNMINTGGPTGGEKRHIVTDNDSSDNSYVGFITRDSRPGLDLSGPVHIGTRTPHKKVAVDAPILLAGGANLDGLAAGVTVQSQVATPEASGTRVMSWKTNPNDATNPGVEIARLNNDGSMYVLTPSGGKIGTSVIRLDNGGISRYSGNNLTIDGGAGGNVLIKQNGLQVNSTGGGVVQYSGIGAPAIAAAVGDAFWRKDGGVGTWLYRCTTGGSATAGAWTAIL